MGELTGNKDGHQENIAKDYNTSKFGAGSEEGYATDVEGVTADDVVKNGKEEYPLFKVSSKEFFDNQKSDRKKIRFANNSKVGEYMRKTKNSHRPFYIKTTAPDGHTYTRKIR